MLIGIIVFFVICIVFYIVVLFILIGIVFYIELNVKNFVVFVLSYIN